ncbi:hypothetical protein GCM10011247_36220 [Pseudomonas plecoglossicida]|nr:hypothetical protein GCM10011247_36220 [Pseudomonas plecoglossicida]
MHAEQVGYFIEASEWNAAPEPVVDVLRRDTTLRREVGRGQAAFMEQGFEAFTGSFHVAESNGHLSVGK